MQAQGADPSLDQRITIVEILGYAGTAIALVGTGAVVGSFTSGGRVVTYLVSALLAIALFLAGFVIGAATPERLKLMRSVLWFLSIGAFQAFVGALIEPSTRAGFFVVLLLTGLAAGALWFLERRTLQQLAFYLSVLGMILVLVAPGGLFGFFGFFGGPPDLAVTAIVTMLIGGAWLVLGYLGLMTPPRTAMVLGSLTVLLGTLILSSETQKGAFLLMALAGAALLAVGNMRSDRAVSGVGIVGLLFGVSVFFGEIVSGDAGSIVALVVGVGILLAAILLGRSWGAVPSQLPTLGNLSPSTAPDAPQGPPPTEPPSS
jgi:hypothetical protein